MNVFPDNLLFSQSLRLSCFRIRILKHLYVFRLLFLFFFGSMRDEGSYRGVQFHYAGRGGAGRRWSDTALGGEWVVLGRLGNICKWWADREETRGVVQSRC